MLSREPLNWFCNRVDMLNLAYRWSASSPETPAGDAALHAYIAQVLYKGKLGNVEIWDMLISFA